MNRHTQIRQVVLARLREQCGDSATFFDGLPAFVDAQELPAVAVWLSDAQYTPETNLVININIRVTLVTSLHPEPGIILRTGRRCAAAPVVSLRHYCLLYHWPDRYQIPDPDCGFHQFRPCADV